MLKSGEYEPHGSTGRSASRDRAQTGINWHRPTFTQTQTHTKCAQGCPSRLSLSKKTTCSHCSRHARHTHAHTHTPLKCCVNESCRVPCGFCCCFFQLTAIFRITDLNNYHCDHCTNTENTTSAACLLSVHGDGEREAKCVQLLRAKQLFCALHCTRATTPRCSLKWQQIVGGPSASACVFLCSNTLSIRLSY